jgi:hypothetical protein
VTRSSVAFSYVVALLRGKCVRSVYIPPVDGSISG